MKKITQLPTLLFFLLMLGWTQLTLAQDLFTRDRALKANEITAGKVIAFKGISVTNTQCINWGGASSGTLSENGIYTVEQGTPENTVLLKRKSDGLYVGKSGDAITLVSDKSQATTFTISQPALNDQEVTGIHEVSLPNMTGTMNKSMNTEQKTEVLKTSWAYEYQVRFTTGETFLNVQGAGGVSKYAGGKGSWSVVMVYEISNEDYAGILLSQYKELVANSAKGAVGCLKASAAKTLQGYIDAGLSGNMEAAKALVAQEENFVAFNPALYYRIENLARKYSSRNTSNINNGGYLEAVDYLEMPQYLKADGYFSNDRSNSRVNAIWKFVSNNTEGQYYLQNMNAGTYMPGKDGAYVTSGVTSKDDATVYTLASLGKGNGQFNIKKAGSAQRLHASGANEDNGAAVMLYSDGLQDSPSAWYLIPATTIEKEITAAGYATANYPFAVKVPADVTAYTGKATAESGVFTLNEIKGGTIPANTPVILAGKANTYTLTILADNMDEPISDNDLIGTTIYKTVEDGANAYILGNNNDKVGFYQMNTEDRTLGANKAYLTLPTAVSSVRSLIFSDGKTTGIESTVAGGTKAEEYYDLQGRRVMNPTKGIFVTKSGKKVLINK